jgi:RHS repeat-associated protein
MNSRQQLLGVLVCLALFLIVPLSGYAAAGRIPGSFAVSPTGAATYNIPIWTPPGTHGLAPGLSLVYTSQRGNGLLGMGWSISGLSAISRCPFTYAQDTDLPPMTLGYGDRFCLDGKRLRLTSSEDLSTYGFDGTTYQTEVADFSNMTAHGSSVGGPTYFTVQGRDGLTYEYGNTIDSQIFAGAGVRTWALDRITDRSGNYVLFSYCNDSLQTPNCAGDTQTGSYRPLKIQYTGNTGQGVAPPYEVTFVYQPRSASDIPSGYFVGVPIQELEQLQEIDIAHNGNAVRQYIFGYDTASHQTSRTRLSTLRECANGDCLATMTFTWQDGPGSWGTASSSDANTDAQHAITLDLNGDGIADMLFAEAPGFSTTCFALGTGATDGFGPKTCTGIPFNSAAPTPDRWNQFVHTNSPRVMDMRGDGKQEVLQYSNAHQQLELLGLDSNGALTEQLLGLSYGCSAANLGPSNGFTVISVGDVDGDGRTDIVYHRFLENGFGCVGDQNGIWVSYNNGTSFGTPQRLLSTVALLRTPSGFDGLIDPFIPIGDINGDGRVDFIVLRSSGPGLAAPAKEWQIILSAGATAASYSYVFGPTLPLSSATASAPANVPPLIGDFNGDGIPDLLYANGTTWQLQYGTGSATSPLSAVVQPNIASQLPQSTIAVDLDGDGRTDVVYPTNNSSGNTFQLARSLGNSFANATSTGVASGSGATTAFDATGQRFADFVTLSPSYALFHTSGPARVQIGQGSLPDLLASANDGFGNAVSIVYRPLTQGSQGLYSPSPFVSPVFPYRNYIVPLHVVSSASFSDPTKVPAPSQLTTYQLSYSYTGAWANVQGRGFGNFISYRVFDSRSKTYETSCWENQFPFTGMPSCEQSSFDASGNSLIRAAFENHALTTLDGTANNQRYFPHYDWVTDQEYQVSGNSPGPLIATRKTSYVFDNFGNPTTVTHTVTDNDASSNYANHTWTVTTTSTPAVDTANWCLPLLTGNQTTTYTLSEVGGSVERTKQFTPDTVNCRYSQIVTEPAATATYKVTEVPGYDAFGNVNSDTVTGVGMTSSPASRSVFIDWGPTGQLPQSITDASGAKTSFEYNFDLGVPSSMQDPNGQKTTWSSDGFGREILEQRPDGTSTSITYNACVPPNTCEPLWQSFVWRYDRDTQSNPITQSVTSYDALDRPLEVSNLALNGSWATILTHYDSLGRVANTTAPFFWGSSRYQHNYSYDLLGRLVQTDFATSSNTIITRYEYSGDTTIFTDADGNHKRMVTDANGWLRQISDDAGYFLFFGYDPAGSHTLTTDNLFNTLWKSSYEYGIQPFPVSITDSDFGTWGYTYDALGELTAWNDAKGQHFSKAYDALSRPTKRFEPDLYTQWTWGSNPALHNIGQLQAVCTGTGINPAGCTGTGYSKGITYDVQARPSQLSIVIPGDNTYTYTETYNDTTGLLDTLTYPTTPLGPALKVKFGYTNSALQSVTNITSSPNVTLWTANQVDPAGNNTQETLGNGVVVKHSFDAATYLLNSITSGVGGGTALQNNSYLFDPVGNLTQRQDNNAGTTESAWYDSLNRLLNTVGDTNTHLTYDGMGRLASWAAFGGAPNVNDYATPQSGCSYYPNAQVHAVRAARQGANVAAYCYDANGNMTTETWQGTVFLSQTWTSYNQPSSMSSPFGSTQFLYDDNHQRWQQSASFGGSPEITTYIGGLLEKVTTASGTTYRHYIPAGNTFSEYILGNTGNPTYYATKDNLGSTSVITDQNGALVVSERYAALGWLQATSAQQAIIGGISRHEFTGEEGVDGTGVSVVNFNGRVYTPNGNFFFSPDPYIPDPTDTRSYNRYAYANFNPLTFTDHSGFDPDCSGGLCLNPNFPIQIPLIPSSYAYPAGTFLDGLAHGVVTMTPLGENVPFTDYGGSAVSSVSSSVPSSYPVGAELNNLVSSGALLAGRTLIPYGTAVLRGENATGTWQDSMLGFLKGGYNLAAGLATLTSPGLMATDGSIPQLPIGKREIGGAAAFELAAMMLPVGVESSLAARGIAGLVGRSGLRAFGETEFRGLVQNRALAGLTDAEVRAAFEGTPYALSNHAISRLLDPRTANLGIGTLNDVAGVLNKGVVGNAGGGLISIVRGNFGAIIDPTTNAIVTFRPF